MENTINEAKAYAFTYREAINKIHKLLDEAGLNPFDLFSYKFLLDVKGGLEKNDQFMFYSEEPFLLLEEAIIRKQKALGWIK